VINGFDWLQGVTRLEWLVRSVGSEDKKGWDPPTASSAERVSVFLDPVVEAVSQLGTFGTS
jgi:hypothetical protein